MNDSGNHSAVVGPRLAARVRGKIRSDLRKLRVVSQYWSRIIGLSSRKP
jgi:hypothetical protein